MTPQQIKDAYDKVENLEWWLTEHPTDPSYSIVLNDKLQLQEQLKNQTHEQ